MAGLDLLLPIDFQGLRHTRSQQFLVSHSGSALDDISDLGKLPMAGARRGLWYQGALFCGRCWAFPPGGQLRKAVAQCLNHGLGVWWLG